MRFSVATAILAATDPSVLAALYAEDPSSPESPNIAQGRLPGGGLPGGGLPGGGLPEGGDSSGSGNPSVRSYRNHWTKTREPVKDGESLPKSVLLTNQKTTKDIDDHGSDTAENNTSARDSRHDEDGGDLGILSPSRRLKPLEYKHDGLVTAERPNSDMFDSFSVVDQGGTAFYPICDPTPFDEYLCFRCDKDSEQETVGDFDCQKISCYDIDSRCPNNQMVVCRYDTLKRMFDYEPGGNSSSVPPYTSEKCRKIETRLTKTNREMLPNEESEWGFSYCLRYNIATLPSFEYDEYGDIDDKEGTASPNTCEMEVDGIVCTSCLLETVDLVDVSSNTTIKEFCASFDCGNTLLGYSGRFCNAADLASNSIDYFVYRSLPCDVGCNLCGDRPETNAMTTMMMMEFRDSNFSTADNDLEVSSSNCFEAQWEALMGYKGGFHCGALQPVVEESCGCKPMGSSPIETATSSPSNRLQDNDSNSTVGGDDGGGTSGAMLATKTSVHTTFLLATTMTAASLIGFGLVEAMAM
jgi:hypothetical protein